MFVSINTVCLFKDKPLNYALERISQAGYDTFELWRLGEGQARLIDQARRRFGMRVSGFCPDEFTLNDGALHAQYERALKKALSDAQTLDCPALITQVGQDTGAPRAAQHEAIVRGLKRVAPYLEKAGCTLLVEPLNDVRDHPGYYLTSSQEGFDIVREVASPRVKLLFDVYHQVHMGEDVLRQIEKNAPMIGHFHVAGHPNRDARIFENFDYRPFFELVNALGLSAPVGLELFPSDEADALALLRALEKYR